MPALTYLRIDHPYGAIPRMKTPQKGLNSPATALHRRFSHKSIIKIRLFNEYPGIKHETPPQKCSAAGFAHVSKQLKSLFQADFGHKKAIVILIEPIKGGNFYRLHHYWRKAHGCAMPDKLEFRS